MCFNKRMMPADAPTTITLLQTNSLTMAVQQEVEGVSRGPVREAFRMLDEAGLVRTEKNRGVFVRNIPIDEAIEIFELRATMEELVGRRLAASMAPEQQQEIEALVHAMEESVKNRDSHSYHLLNLQFHDRLVEMAGNRKLAMIYRKLVKEIALFRRLNLAGQNVLPESAHAHWAKSGNPEVAGRAMFEHAMGSRNRTIENDELRRRADTTPTES